MKLQPNNIFIQHETKNVAQFKVDFLFIHSNKTQMNQNKKKNSKIRLNSNNNAIEKIEFNNNCTIKIVKNSKKNHKKNFFYINFFLILWEERLVH